MKHVQYNPYNVFLLVVSGLGGLLYGIDIGIIDPALSYLNKSVDLSEAELSAIVAAVLAGSIVGPVVAGLCADMFGRKPMMISSGACFVVSVGIIFMSKSFCALMVGRLMQGTSGGVIAVVVPLYLAECLPATIRGRGAAVFQFMLTIGILLAAIVGRYYTGQAEASIQQAGIDLVAIRTAADTAWRGMFLAIIYPGCLFLLGASFLSESPRWLAMKNKGREAGHVLLAMRGAETATAELEEIEKSVSAERARPHQDFIATAREVMTERRYVLPFIFSCIVLGCCQATGINSILQFMSNILQKAGLDAVAAASYGSGIKVINVVMTVFAIVLVERKGRVFLLKLGTTGITISLLVLSILFYQVESRQSDVRPQLESMIVNHSLSVDLSAVKFDDVAPGNARQISILYSVGGKHSVLEVALPNEESAAAIEQAGAEEQQVLLERARQLRSSSHIQLGRAGEALQIIRTRIGPIPPQNNGLFAAICIGAFIASFSIGPGVCVWLALSELMPTRIRSVGMGIALLVNQGVATAIAFAFLPVAGEYGYAAMFLFWSACTLVFLLLVTLFLPETKGKTLEQIAQYFERNDDAPGTCICPMAAASACSTSSTISTAKT